MLNRAPWIDTEGSKDCNTFFLLSRIEQYRERCLEIPPGSIIRPCYLYHCCKLRYAQRYYYHNRQQRGIWEIWQGRGIEGTGDPTGPAGLIAIMAPESARDRRNGKRLDSRRWIEALMLATNRLIIGRRSLPDPLLGNGSSTIIIAKGKLR